MTEDDIIALETGFWQKLVDKDSEGSAAMITKSCVSASPRGVRLLDPEAFARNTRDDNWSLDSFELNDIVVTLPNAETAIIAYRVLQKGYFGEDEMSLECADSSTWIRCDDGWKCAAHTESLLA